ncbi:MAG TPA: MurR/RpiR family transcriptional regulator [Caulobacteraceae bacterium]|nr:MurR/RpiR family transcriptional regulator [Caulobacteraceae bacterium]
MKPERSLSRISEQTVSAHDSAAGSVTKRAKAATTSAELRAEVFARYDTLSKRLRQFARYLLEEPNELALETLSVVAERSGVQPSAIVRFAQRFGFDGASQMQTLFRDELLAAHPAAAYGERARQFQRAVQGHGGDATSLLEEFAAGNSLALGALSRTTSPGDFSSAVRMLERASLVYVVGVRRAFPVAAYLAYSLQQAGKRTFFVDGVAGLAAQQTNAMTSGDLLIAISYEPYAEETIQAVEAAAASGAPVVAITDSPLSPIAKPAAAVLQVREAEIRGFRSLSASICLAQALVIDFVFHAEAGGGKGRPRSGPRRKGAA